jgi:threonine synthase
MNIYEKSSYIADPHGAVGYLGLKKYGLEKNDFGVFLETAHPVKFLDVVESTLPVKVAIPEQIENILDKEKIAKRIHSYQELKEYLTS